MFWCTFHVASLALAWNGPKAGVLQHLIPASYPYALSVGAQDRVTFTSNPHGRIGFV